MDRLRKAFIPHHGQNVAPTGDAYANEAGTVPVENGNGTHIKREGAESDTDSQRELERIHTFERVGTHAQYYEKDGLRTEGDGVDHDGAHHKMTPKLFMSLVCMSLLWIGSQIPLYIFGSVVTSIYADIGGVDRWVWFVIGYLIPVAALCPFVGALSDMFGRRYVAMIGQMLLILGPVVTATANTMNIAIAGQVFSGLGAGLNELTSLAGTGEMVPTAKRGLYVGLMILTILPFSASVVYAQLINRAKNWRYCGFLVGGWNLLGLIMVIIFYHPPPRVNSLGYSRREILRRIDFIGGFLSIGGILCFMMGMQWSAQQYTWGSVHVLVPFILGIILIIAFFVWELVFAKYPMVPARVFIKAKRTMILILLITFLSGANFFAVLLWWPTEIYNVYGNDPIGVGLRSLPVGFGILGGAVVCLILIPVTGGRIKALMVFFCAMMTAFTGALSIATPTNMNTMWAIITLSSFAVGAIIIPCSIIAQICCPDDLIATITAITLSVRYVGGAIGFTIYYNVFYNKLVNSLTEVVAYGAIVGQLGYFNKTIITEMTLAIGNAQYQHLHDLIRETHQTTPWFYNIIVTASYYAFAEAYRWPYYISIAFGAICFILALFVGDIKEFLDDHIAVVVA